MLQRARLLVALLLSLAATNALAWGTQGHQVVANLAYAQLTPKTRAEVDRVLALEPGATLASVSTWADETRNRTTAPWHYVNFPRDTCIYYAHRDCPDGQCVVGAIDRQLEVLASKAPDEKRLNALKYAVHLVADVHQPLHAGYADDRGGNTYQVQAFGRGTNLHAAHAAEESCRVVGTPEFNPGQRALDELRGAGTVVAGAALVRVNNWAASKSRFR